MKKIKYLIFLLLIIFIGSNNILAKEINYEGSTGVYVKKELGSNYESSNIRKYSKYGTKNYLYSIEAFARNTFDASYKILDVCEENISERVKMIAYVADKLFNEKNDVSYYGVAQVMIWNLLKDEGNITLNDENKYKSIIKEISEEVDRLLEFTLEDMNINLDEEVVIDLNDYEIKSIDTDILDYKIVDNKLILKGLKNGNTSIKFKKLFNDKDYDMEFFKNDTYTDYISAGNFYVERSINVNILGGAIKLNITGDDKFLASYGIFDSKDNMIFKIDTDKSNSYLSNALGYGKYYVKQLSINEGYKVDSNLYEIELNSDVKELDLKIVRDKYKVDINFRNSEGEIIKDVIEYKINNTYTAVDGTSSIWIEKGIYELEILSSKYTLCEVEEVMVLNDQIVDVYLLDTEEVAIEVPDTISYNYIYILLGIVYVKKFIFN